MKQFYLAVAIASLIVSTFCAYIVATRPVRVVKVENAINKIYEDRYQSSGQANCEKLGGVAILVDNGRRLKDCIFPPKP